MIGLFTFLSWLCGSAMRCVNRRVFYVRSETRGVDSYGHE